MQNEGFPCYKSHLDRLKVYVERSLNSNHLVLSYILPLIFQDLLMKRPATTTVILGQMGGGVMPMNAQNYAEEQLNLLQRKSTWLVEWFGCFNLFFLWFSMVLLKLVFCATLILCCKLKLNHQKGTRFHPLTFWIFIICIFVQVRDPMPPVFFFLIDVSINAVQTGATAATCSAIGQAIADLPVSLLFNLRWRNS